MSTQEHILNSPILPSTPTFPSTPPSYPSPSNSLRFRTSPTGKFHAQDYPSKYEARRRTVRLELDPFVEREEESEEKVNWSKPLQPSPIRPEAASALFGTSSQRSRRRQAPSFSDPFHTPETSHSSSSTPSSASSSPVTPLYEPPSPLSGHPKEKTSFFSFKNRSLIQQPVKKNGLVGLGVMGWHSEEYVAERRARSSGRREPEGDEQSRPASRLFRVGRGKQATLFEPVNPSYNLYKAQQAVVYTIAEDEDANSVASSSEDDFVSYCDEIDLFNEYLGGAEDEQRHSSAGPSTMAELEELKASAERMFEEACSGRTLGSPTIPARVESRIDSPPSRRVKRKAVPAILAPFDEEEPSSPDTLTSDWLAPPSIPQRSGSIPQEPLFSIPSAGIARSNRPAALEPFAVPYPGQSQSQGSSSGSHTPTSSSSSMSSIMSSHTSPSHIPITPASTNIADPFGRSTTPMYELDVASVLERSPRTQWSGSPPLSSSKGFYNNQEATKSRLALFASKFRRK